MQNEPNLQKSQMNVNPYNTTVYENKWQRTLGENEPNTNPIKPKTNPILSAVGGLQMFVNLYLTKDYENKSNWKLGENKANTKPIKPNTKPIQTQFPKSQK